MATTQSLKTIMANGNGAISNTVKGLLSQDNYKRRFEELLGKKAPGFISSIINAVHGNYNLQKCDPSSVIAAAVVAATLDLPIDNNLGFAYIIPYGDKAQFQMGYKAFIQLAIRTGQYRNMNACEVYEGELVSYNKLTGMLVLDESKKASETVIGYAAYFELVNGFQHALYWSADRVKKHAFDYSQAYRKEASGTNKNKKFSSPWITNFDDMAKKTVLKQILSKYGILSIEMYSAFEKDQAVMTDTGEVSSYIDNPPEDVIDVQPEPPEAEEPQESHPSTPAAGSGVPTAQELQDGRDLISQTMPDRLVEFDAAVQANNWQIVLDLITKAEPHE